MKKIPVRRSMCATCVLRCGNPMYLSAERLAEIQTKALNGVTQLCHEERGPKGGQRRVACRGVRQWALTIWHRLGWIAAPTDSALDAAIDVQAKH